MNPSITARLTLCAALTIGPLWPQTPAFEVAAIRPASFPTPDTMRSGQFHAGMKIKGLSLDFGFVTLADLIPYAYRVKSFQVSGPAWMRESRWNILARLPEGASQDQAPEMIQALLAERFKLTIHREKREQPVYELVLGKGGPKLEASVEGGEPSAQSDTPGPPGPFPGGPPFGGPFGGPGNEGGARVSPGANCAMHMEFKKLTMATLADTLTPFLDRPVVDQTGFKGDYKVTLDLPMEVMFAMMQNQVRTAGLPPPGQGGGPGGRGGDGPGGGPRGCPDPGAALAAGGVDTSSAPIFQAVQRLGLKLQAHKAPFESIVVDHLEKTPAEN